MTRRFTPEELYALRNEIPIDILIERYLPIPCHRTKKRFQFTCPLCGGFKTSVLWKKNLGRCFECNENFNTIDLAKQTDGDFVAGVKRLIKIRAEMKQPRRSATSAGKAEAFVPIGKIISDILPSAPLLDSEKSVDKTEVLSGRMDELEAKIENLSHQIDRLCRKLISE